MAIHVIEEANRCLQCKVPRCQQGCPIHTNVPQLIRLFKESQVEEAAQMLFENNPLSVVCSLVCDHASQCEGHCVRGLKGEPVHISSIENYISDSALERVQIPKKADNGMKAAVIGAGPAGITISMILASRGYKVTLFESRDKIGGIMRYGIPEFRLPHSILDRIALKMKELGILEDTDNPLKPYNVVKTKEELAVLMHQYLPDLPVQMTSEQLSNKYLHYKDGDRWYAGDGF